MATKGQAKLDRVTVGDVEITSLSDGVRHIDSCGFFPTVRSEDWVKYPGALSPEHHVSINLGSYLVRSAGRTILVDTGMGPLPEGEEKGTRGELLVDLEAKGIRRDEIDLVVMTHMHLDHVGWNLMTRAGVGGPTFPKARYWLSKGDFDFFTRPENAELSEGTRPQVLPLHESGLLDLMEGETQLTSEISTVPTPGHTPGHMSILVSSQGEKALILGDAAHHPVQVHETEWCSRVDLDRETSVATRQSLMERLERESVLLIAGHFPAPGFGRVVRLEGRRYWQVL